MSTAEKIFQRAQALPEPAQDKLLHVADELARQYLSTTSSPLKLHEAAELRGIMHGYPYDAGANGQRHQAP